MTKREDQVKALSNEVRLEILRVLENASENFSEQQSADPEKVGVCIQLIAKHFDVSQPTMSRHIELLKRAGFVVAKRQQKWTYCSRDEKALTEYIDWFGNTLSIKKF